MTKYKNWISLALRTAMFLYLPIFSLLYILFQFLFGKFMPIQLGTALSYLFILITWITERYKHDEYYIDIDEKERLESTLRNGRWEEIDRQQETITVRPTYDFPYNLVVNDWVQVQFTDQRFKLTGPLHYVSALSDAIKKRESSRKKSVRLLMRRTLVVAFISLPFFRETGIIWELNVLRHNAEASGTSTEWSTETGSGNSAENINNDGLGVETEEGIIYLHGDRSIIKTTQSFKYDELLVNVEDLYEVGDLNIADDWLYYADYASINRIRLDGTEQETLYDLGHFEDLHLINDRLYFINYADNYNIYSMNLNGYDLKRVADVEARGLTAYDDELLVSHDRGVDRISLDGSEREPIIEEYGSSVVRHDDHYYYLNSDSYLYKQSVHSSTNRVRTRILDRPVDRYTLTGDELFYVQHNGVYSHASRGLFKSDHQGSESERLHPSGEIYSLTKVGDYILFTVSGGYKETIMMTYDLNSGELDEIF